MHTELITDPVILRDKAFPYLRGDPVLHSGHLSGISDAVALRLPLTGVLIYRDDAVYGLASCSAGEYIWLGALADDAVPSAAAALAQVAASARQVNGTDSGTALFAAEWQRHTGHHATIGERNRLHRLRTLRPATAPGRPRPAIPAETGRCYDWITASLSGTLTPAMLAARIAAGLIWLWEHDGEPVSLVGHHHPAFGAARVGPVCTPPQFRGNGYASALTAHVTGLLAGQGHQVCLYTDQANPTSNKIYAALGFEPVADYMFREFH